MISVNNIANAKDGPHTLVHAFGTTMEVESIHWSHAYDNLVRVIKNGTSMYLPRADWTIKPKRLTTLEQFAGLRVGQKFHLTKQVTGSLDYDLAQKAGAYRIKVSGTHYAYIASVPASRPHIHTPDDLLYAGVLDPDLVVFS